MRHERFLASCLLLLSCTAVSALQAARVTATVVGPTGTPIKGARVAVSNNTIDGKTLDTELETDSEGRFTVDIREAPVATSPYYPARFLIAAPGMAVSGGTWKKDETVFRLEPGVSLSGTVVDTAGKPVADAQVLLRTVRGKDAFHRIDLAPWLKLVAEKFIAKSGADGRWTILGVPREGRASIGFHDPRYLRHSVQVDLSPTMADVPPFIARPGVRASGRVVYETGGPAVGVSVSTGSGVTTTAADGSFLLPAMPSGPYGISVQEGSGDWVAANFRGVTTPQMQSVTVPDLVLQRGVLLTGEVLDTDTGEPIAGAIARAEGAHSIMVSRPSDEKGRYQLRVLPGKSQFYLFFVPGSYLRERSLSQMLSITPEQTQIPPFRLKRGLTLAGTAVDEAGRPATGALIRITTDSTRTRFSAPAGWVDAQGIWTIRGIDIEEMGVAVLAADESWEMTPVPLKLPTDRPLALTLRRVK